MDLLPVRGAGTSTVALGHRRELGLLWACCGFALSGDLGGPANALEKAALRAARGLATATPLEVTTTCLRRRRSAPQGGWLRHPLRGYVNLLREGKER